MCRTVFGGVAELAYAADLKYADFGLKGSSPFAPTIWFEQVKH